MNPKTDTESPVASAPPAAAPTLTGSRITKIAPHAPKESIADKARGLAGAYRMIHGTLLIPRPWDEWHTANGEEIMGEPKTVGATIHAAAVDLNGNATSWVGDELWLDDIDAYHALEHDIVEPVDVPLSESRCGKVWDPPKPGAITMNVGRM